MHRAGSRVDPGVMATGRFVDLRRVARELVPETVEVDALAAGDQTLGVRAAEVEVPQRGQAHNLIPRRDAGHRRIYHNQAACLVRIARRVGIRDHRADVVPTMSARSMPSLSRTAR